MEFVKFCFVIFLSVFVKCQKTALNEKSDVEEVQCSAVFKIPGIASELGHSLCQIAAGCTSCCSYNTTCCGLAGCCNGSCCDGICCDINYGTCQKLSSSNVNVCVPNGHTLCGDTICDTDYKCCGTLCVPDGSDCCHNGSTGSSSRFCEPSAFCCGSGCCDSTSSICCSDHESCCSNDLPNCCPTTCCDGNSYCCADGCCPHGSDHCGDGYYCDSGSHCCGSGSSSWCCNSEIDCCRGGCCTDSSPKCSDGLCWSIGWQPCSDLETESDGTPKIPLSKYGNWDQQSKCRSTSKANKIDQNQPETKAIRKSRRRENAISSPSVKWHKFSSIATISGSIEVPMPKISGSPNCLINDVTSTDPCIGFQCFMQISDCKSDNGYLKTFGEGILCNKGAESSSLNDFGRIWWNCSKTCITSEIKSTMATALVPCCNSMQEFGLNYVNKKCFVDRCNFCSMYADNFVALKEMFDDKIENVYWQQILNFIDDCELHTNSASQNYAKNREL